ncbi:hypothetical protein BDA99DRAFT_527753 [Phascolomyces articulosus]|uniref:DUF221-domain-containing protein n=1 Tax=Phascolomyces articulosus TaxID=60185 RepID=A0AAD5JM52_9FUNG|nr:hypothetical protein BDA99DRAFT_527753 [Phascolomyces articulosus]
MYLRFLKMATHFLTVQVIITCPLLLLLHWFAASLSPSAPLSSSSSFTLNTTSHHYHYPNVAATAAGIVIDDVDNSDYYAPKTPTMTSKDAYTNFQSNATLYQLSISNVPHEAPIMWVHVILTWIISLSWLWLLFVNYWHHLLLLLQQQQQEDDMEHKEQQDNVDNEHHSQRQNKNKTKKKNDNKSTSNKYHQHVRRSHTVLLTNVPHHLRNVQSLYQHFSSEMGPVQHVYLVSQAGIDALHKTLLKRQDTMDQLERKLILWHRRQHPPPPPLLQRKKKNTSSSCSIEESYCCQQRRRHSSTSEVLCWLPTMNNHDDPDMIRLVRQLDRLDAEIEQLREFNRVSTRYQLPTGTAFITFKSIESAQICAKMSWKPGVFQTQIAPEPRDLLWNGLLRQGRRDKLMGRLRQWIVFIAVWSLTIFWLFPVSFILGLTSIESLSQHFGFLKYFMDTSDVVRSFIQNILPMLLVTLFMSVLPWILLAISKQQDFVSYSALEDAVLGRYYRFAIFNVLIVFLLGTSFLSTLLDVLYEPGKLIHLLGKFLPQGANFFLNYILFNSATHAMELVQLGSQLFGHLWYRLRYCLSRTPLPRKLLKTKPWSFPYYYYYPNHILVFVITLTYSVIQPLILLFALFYFLVAVQVFRHQFAYAYVRQYETNGFHYRRMAGYTSDGLVIFQLTMTGLLYLKGAIMPATGIVPLTLITIWAKIKLSHHFSQRRPKIHFRPPPPPPQRSSSTGAEQDDSEKERDIDSLEDYNDGGIWKLAYIKAWWYHGRYAPQHFPTYRVTTLEDYSNYRQKKAQQQQQQQQQYESTNVNLPPPPSSPATSTSTDKCALVVTIEESEQQEHDALLTNYPDDAPREDEKFEYPPLVTPLEQYLWLPRDPHRRCWDVDDCILISLDDIRRSLIPSSSTSSSSTSSSSTSSSSV